MSDRGAQFLDERVADQARTASPAGMHLLRAHDLRMSAPSWLIKDFIESDSLSAFVGGFATGKSFLAIAALCSVATGADFFGRKTKKGAAIYLCGEGRSGIRRRLTAWEAHHGISLANADLHITSSAAALVDDQGHPLVAACESAGVEPSLIVIDTLARNYGFGDENSSADMGAFVGALDRLRMRFSGASILVVHHSGHADKSRARGSTAFMAALDSGYLIERDLNGIVTVTCSKMKDAEAPPPECFKLTRVDIGLTAEDGTPVFGAALELTEPGEKVATIPSGRNQQVALKVLRDLFAVHVGNIEKAGRDPSEAWVSKADWRRACLAQSIDKRRLSDVLESLIRSGRVVDGGAYVRPAVSSVVPIR